MDPATDGPGGEPALHFHNVHFSYGSHPVLTGATFHVATGDFAALVGPNGAGKSTLLKLMLGLLRPSAGSIIVMGRNPEQASSSLGYVPQHGNFDAAFPIRVREVVAMGLTTAMGRPRKNPEALDRAMEAARISELADRSFGALSGGQRRRVLLARALAGDPSLILLDEPTANLDSQSEDRLFQVLADLKGRKTLVLVSHDTAFVSSLTDAVYCLGSSDSPGKVVHHRTGVEAVIPARTLRVLHDTKVQDGTGCSCGEDA